MPGLKVVLNSGSWSDTTIWSGGIKPSAGDVVCANGYTVVIDENITAGTLTTTAQVPTTAIPIMTGYTTPYGTVTANNLGSGASLAWKAFNGVTIGNNDSWWPQTDPAVTPLWVAYEFTSSINIDKYGLVLRGDTYNPRNWTFEYWDGANWIILHTVSGSSGITSYTSPTLANTGSYTKYRYNVTQANGAGSIMVPELYMYERYYTDTGSAGGGFILNGGVTASLNSGNGIVNGTTTCLNYSSSINSWIIGSVTGSTAGVVNTLIHNGSGTLTIVGNVRSTTVSSGGGIIISGSGRLNVIGLTTAVGQTYTYLLNSTGSLNLVGDVYWALNSSNGRPITVSNSGQVNITGNLYYDPGALQGGCYVISCTGGSPTITITGNISAGNGTDNPCVYLSGGTPKLVIVGSVTGGGNATSYGVSSVVASNIRIVGPVTATNSTFGLYSTSTSAINILTGPFISSTYGVTPVQLYRMHYEVTSASYWEFRNNETSGALSPGPTASAVRLFSPDTVLSPPSVSNVRLGVTFASGSFVGTLAMPSASSVAYGIPVDNTTGSALITPADVWNYLSISGSVTGSIGERIKDVSTINTTGQQLAALTR